jgi:alcohol dehydrogenase (cytochrome c)
MRRQRKLLAVLFVPIFGFLTLFYTVPKVNWRIRLIALQARGEIQDLPWTELFRGLRAGSGFETLVRTKNAYSVIRNPFTSQNDIDAGRRTFRERCTVCHGSNAHGAPDLARIPYVHGDSDWALYRNAVNGIPHTGMTAQLLNRREAWQVVSYVRSLTKAQTIDERKRAEPEPMARLRPVPFERIRDSAETAHDWLTYSGTYSGQRYSKLAEITRKNVNSLKLEWIFQTSSTRIEASPIVVDGIMYLTEPPDKVRALDARDGRILWTYQRTVPSDLKLCCGMANRGAAMLGGRLYFGTLDAHLVALDARTGTVVWDVEVADHTSGYSITGAPLAVKDKVIVGIAGGDYGIRGFLDAYDAETGDRAWRFYTIPKPGEAGHETWIGDSWKTGGGATWVTGSYDPKLNLIYWGVGNPAPVFRGDPRKGDNLYTNCLVAVDLDTGKLRWHFQFTPHDEHDWDANHVPVLVDMPFAGHSRRLVLSATKNAFFYGLDPTSGQFLIGHPFARQTWAKGLDPQGRPIEIPGRAPSERGTLVYPGAGGATNWWSPSYSPRTGLFYLPVSEKGSIFFKQPSEKPTGYRQGEILVGSAFQGVPNEPQRTFVRALDPTTGKLEWEYAFPPRSGLASVFDSVGGVLSTAGDLLFVGDNTVFHALDAYTGKMLWQARLGGRINASPITYGIDGRQFVTIAAGSSIVTFSMSER